MLTCEQRKRDGEDLTTTEEHGAKRRRGRATRASTAVQHQKGDQGRQRRLQKSIEFDSVFQGGDAKYKHKIIEYPAQSGNWFILRCDDHAIHFGDKPILSATCHLRSKDHGGLTADSSTAVQELGISVLNCDASKATQNNAVFSAALSRGYQILKGHSEDSEVVTTLEPPTEHTLDGHQQDEVSAAQPVQRKTRPFDGITDPVVGDLYLGYWPGASADWYAIIVLPTGDFKTLGISGSIFDTHLGKGHIPVCYEYDKTGSTVVDWANGYEDGGPDIHKRKFPVMYFDDDQTMPAEGDLLVPSDYYLGWLSAKHLRPFSVWPSGQPRPRLRCRKILL